VSEREVKPDEDDILLEVKLRGHELVHEGRVQLQSGTRVDRWVCANASCVNVLVRYPTGYAGSMLSRPCGPHQPVRRGETT
jgi:hypothetical protein